MPPCPQLKTCCCCFTTETGSKIIGWFQAICCTIATIVAIFALVVSVTYKKEDYEITKNPDGTFTNKTMTEAASVEAIAYSASAAVIYLLMAILGIYLLIGVYKRNMSYVRLWVIISLILLCISVVVTVIRIIMKIAGKDDGDIIEPIISNIFSAYFTLVVYSFYRDGKAGTGGNY